MEIFQRDPSGLAKSRRRFGIADENPQARVQGLLYTTIVLVHMLRGITDDVPEFHVNSHHISPKTIGPNLGVPLPPGEFSTGAEFTSCLRSAILNRDWP